MNNQIDIQSNIDTAIIENDKQIKNTLKERRKIDNRLKILEEERYQLAQQYGLKFQVEDIVKCRETREEYIIMEIKINKDKNGNRNKYFCILPIFEHQIYYSQMKIVSEIDILNYIVTGHETIQFNTEEMLKEMF